MTAPTLGLALIARDEEDVLSDLLASIEGAFDQVVLLDTGSTDRTVEVFEGWAAFEGERNPAFVHTVGSFEWCDDFAAARNAADELLDTDWLCWADCDEVIFGAGRLRGVVASAPGRVKEVLVDHRYPDPPQGFSVAPRERLVRRSVGARWIGRLHEGKSREGITEHEVLRVQGDVAHWTTQRSSNRESSLKRNARVLRRWISDEPTNRTPLRMLAAQEMMHGSTERGLTHVEEYLRLRSATMTAREAAIAEWAFGELTQIIKSVPTYVPPEGRGVLQALLVITLDCLPHEFSNGSGQDLIPAAEVEHTTPAPPGARQTRQQRRAEARARAKKLAVA